MCKQYNKKIVVVVSLIVGLINISLMFNNNVWCDEAATINLTKLTIPQLLDAVIKDVHPPVYYLMLKFGAHFFGHNIIYYKFMSIIPCVIMIGYVNLWIVRNVEKNATLACVIFAILAGLSPCAQGKNLEVRMYSWAALWVCMSVLLGWEVTTKLVGVRKKILFVICTLMAMYTHYFALLTVAIALGIRLFKCIKKEGLPLARIWYIYAIIILGYIPWVPFMLKQMKESTAVWPIKIDITPAYVIDLFRYPFEGDYSAYFTNEYTILMWTIILTIISLGIINVKKCIKNNELIILKLGLEMIWVSLGTVVAGLVISISFHPILFKRYLYPTMGLVWLSISILFVLVDYKVEQRVFFVGLVALLCVSAYKNSYNREYITGTSDTLQFSENNFETDDILVNNFEICMCWELKYYFPNNQQYYLEDGTLMTNDGMTLWSEKADFDIYSVDKNVWYFCKGQFDLDINKLQTNGYRIDAVYEGDFDNYYAFTLYHITKI